MRRLISPRPDIIGHRESMDVEVRPCRHCKGSTLDHVGPWANLVALFCAGGEKVGQGRDIRRHMVLQAALSWSRDPGPDFHSRRSERTPCPQKCRPPHPLPTSVSLVQHLLFTFHELALWQGKAGRVSSRDQDEGKGGVGLPCREMPVCPMGPQAFPYPQDSPKPQATSCFSEILTFPIAQGSWRDRGRWLLSC